MTSFGVALTALTDAGIRYRFPRLLHPSMPGMDDEQLDLWIAPAQGRGAEAALRSAGFHRVRAPGHGRHRFFVAWQSGRWRKIDVKLGRPPDPSRLATAGGIRTVARRPWGAVARRMPAGPRRTGPVVAILGPDGAGKGSVIAALQDRIPIAMTARSLGGGAGRRARRARNRSGSNNGSGIGNGYANGNGGPPVRGRPGPVRECAFVLVKAARAWIRLVSVYAMAWRGHIVLCDRHPIEVLATRPDRTPLAGRLERFLARRLTPRPDAIVVLDAPAEVLFSRKREHSVALLERWRNAYIDVFTERGATTISTVGPPEGSVDAASQVVWEALRERRRW
jgi:thymidylate kinase